MANEKRLLIYYDDLVTMLAKTYRETMDTRIYSPRDIMDSMQGMRPVDAVGADEMREFAKDVAYQFGYYCQNGGRLHITHGGLSTLEYAFDILGWENPHPVPECECEIDGCHEHATCGAPTADGYKRMCGKHCRERRRQ